MQRMPPKVITLGLRGFLKPLESFPWEGGNTDEEKLFQYRDELDFYAAKPQERWRHVVS